MKVAGRSVVFSAIAFLALAMASDPLVGVWQLDHQELNGQKKETEALTLRVSQEGDKLLFAFAVPVNNIDFVSLTYTARLDGTEADVKNSRGDKIGTVQVTSPARSHYKVTLKGPNRPDTTVNLTISANGQTLISESDGPQGAQTAHLKQTFARR